MLPTLAHAFRLIRRSWMAFAHVVGVVQNFILLTLLYFLILGPIALCLRLLGRDLLALRGDDRATSYCPKDHVPADLERCERQF
jgi:hypothetical protein